MYFSRNTLGINCLFLRAKGTVTIVKPLRYDSETLENGFFFPKSSIGVVSSVLTMDVCVCGKVDDLFMS